LPVTDTAPEAERIQWELIMARTPAERFMMGALMFDAARTMVLASFPSGLSPNEVRRRLFDRFYGDEENLRNPYA
jgi:hypothetical protein